MKWTKTWWILLSEHRVAVIWTGSLESVRVREIDFNKMDHAIVYWLKVAYVIYVRIKDLWQTAD